MPLTPVSDLDLLYDFDVMWISMPWVLQCTYAVRYVYKGWLPHTYEVKKYYSCLCNYMPPQKTSCKVGRIEFFLWLKLMWDSRDRTLIPWSVCLPSLLSLMFLGPHLQIGKNNFIYNLGHILLVAQSWNIINYLFL